MVLAEYRPERQVRIRPGAAATGVVAVSTLAILAGAGRPGGWPVIAAGLALAVVAAVRIRSAFRAGRAAEQARWLRLLHDTALQSLEAMALASESDRDAPAEELTRVRAAARREAVALRGNLAELAGAGRSAGSLAGALAEVIDALPAGSPRVELVGDEPATRLTPAGRTVLRDATREAVGNAVRHAGAARIVVRIAESGPGVVVVIRDDGHGFDPARTAPGFGIRQSITARLREAGGTATVESAPGRGTRVRLWLPVTTSYLRRRPRR